MDIYNEISLTFTPENFKQVLLWGATPDEAPHSHLAIAGWCERFWNSFSGKDAPPEIEEILPLLAEVEVEWDCYVAAESHNGRRYSKEKYQLPTEYFEKWLNKLNT